MLITICYSLLTWIQCRKRAQIGSWIQETCIKQGYSLLLINRDRTDEDRSPGHSSSLSQNRCLVSSTSSLVSTSTHDLWPVTSGRVSMSSTQSLANLSLAPQVQISPLCLNQEPRSIRLLWESPQAQALVITPHQTVELHDWTSWLHKPDRTAQEPQQNKTTLNLLIEAEPGLVLDKTLNRKFTKFGNLVAWKCDNEFTIILQSTVEQVIELMHVYRLAGITLEGSWRVYRVTTVSVKGVAGTLISFKDSYSTGSTITPAGLRRLSAGIYECTDSPAGGTPKNGLSKATSKYKIPLISEDSLDAEASEEEQAANTVAPLLNWHERSPLRKQSTPNIFHHKDRTSFTLPRRKAKRSSSLSEKSISLASLFCSKSPSRSISVDEAEEDFEETVDGPPAPIEPERPHSRELLEDTASALLPNLAKRRISSSTSAMDRSNSPTSHGDGDPNCVQKRKFSASANRIPPVTPSKPISHARRGKPPNILILCPDDSLRQSIHTLLKSMLPADRYVIYEIRWDQVSVGGWADQTALLVLSGPIPEPTVNVPILLQFLGDGGRLFAWCSETPPFGIPPSPTTARVKDMVVYGPAQAQTKELFLESGWGQVMGVQGPPSNFPRILESVDSEGTSRPLTTSVVAKSKDKGQAVVLQLDGGTLGGKAILSQIHFEERSDDGLFSYLLSGSLGLDSSTKFKPLEHTPGFLLGDHKIILNFLSKTPPRLEQPQLKVEFLTRDDKGPTPTHELLPVHYFECPKNFSTVQYFENLTTRELGRLVIYTDVISSVMNVLCGRPLQHGLVVIAKQQTAGRGRGKNVWLSPEGSALFAFQIHVNNTSGIARRLSLVQHLTALAMILAVPPHREIDLRVKWPNDVYLGGEKVGGILVESLMEGQRFVVNIGVGFNVSNLYPTTSLNQALKKAMESAGLDLSPFSTERYIARTLSELERLLDSVDTAEGLEDIISLYTSNWIHSADEEVSVEVGKGNWATCRIQSIDEFGFMRVCEVETGNTFSVQPDGNSFDIANRLISIK